MQSLTRTEKLVVLMFLVWLTSRDGDISSQEMAFLEDTAFQLGIDPLPPLSKLKCEKDPFKLLEQMNSQESKRLLIELLVKISFVDGVYDARERAAVAATASALGIPWSVVEDLEHELVEELNVKLTELASETTTKSEAWDLGKVATIAGITVAGGAALALTGGLAAPVIGGAIGSTLLGLSGAAATSAGLAFIGGGSLAAGGLGMAGGTALVATALGAGGAGVAAWKANHLMGDIQEWEIQHIGGRGLHVCLGIGGFLQQGEDHISTWSPLQEVFPKACNYTLAWESKALHDLGNVVSSLSQKSFSGAVVGNMALSASKKALGMAALPVAALSALEIIDNPWFVARNRADQAGKLLGDWIADDKFGSLPVTLVGYSLGTRVIVAALDRLAERDAVGKIYDVYLLAGAVAKDDSRLKSFSNVVSGNVVNVYSRNDLVLAYLYRAAELFAQPIGASELDLEGVLNIDVTETVGGHLKYEENLQYILTEINFRLGRSGRASRVSQQRKAPTERSANATDSIIGKLMKRLNEVPGMTPANLADFYKSQPFLKLENGVRIHTWKNSLGVDHVFISNERRQCIYGGYVGWIHSSGLEVALQALRRDYETGNL